MPKVLIIEDDQDVRELAAMALQSSGICVTECDSAHEARKTLQQDSFDLILLDLTLSDGNSINLIDEIYSKPNLTNNSVVIFSAASDRAALHPYRNRIAGTIEKPFEIRELADKVLAFIHNQT